MALRASETCAAVDPGLSQTHRRTKRRLRIQHGRLWPRIAIWLTFIAAALVYARFSGVNSFGDKRPSGAGPSANVDLLDNYPPDQISKDARESGAVALHVLGMLYMFLGLAIVCDDFFVPALEVMVAKFELNEDVAGATFMAAGGSAPELFTSFIGVFIAKSDVGIGTIVGSAVFNVLFVIGMCAIFSLDLLELTWWPLFRDSMFYSVDLAVLAYFFADGEIQWWESLIMFTLYGAYVFFMSYNERIEKWFKQVVAEYNPRAIRARQNVESKHPRLTRQYTLAQLRSMFAMGEDPEDMGKDTFGRTRAPTRIAQRRASQADAERRASQEEFAPPLTNRMPTTIPENSSRSPASGTAGTSDIELEAQPLKTSSAGAADISIVHTQEAAQPEDDDEGGVDLAWPSEGSLADKLDYIIRFPIVGTLYLVLGDVSQEENEGRWPWVFVGSILFIGIFSYFMVWWATVFGDVVGIPSLIMGLTILAAGTSVPDLLTSVIVARKGFGDMAVSSSIGSNIFDVTVGLPVPWLCWSLINGLPISVGSDNIAINILILFCMLLAVIAIIFQQGWKMTKPLGYTMFLLYLVFVVVSIGLEQSWF